MTTFRYTIQLSDGTREVIIPALEVQSASGALSTGRQIQSITPGTGGTGQFVLSGDVTFPTPEGSPPGPGIRFQPGDEFQVSGEQVGSPTNNQLYTVASVIYSGSPDITTINVNEDVLATLPLGQIRYATPNNGSPQIRTDLEISGKGVINHGEYLNTNLLHMLENFASITPPASPIDGELWYDKNAKMINVFTAVGSPGWSELISAADAESLYVNAAGDTMTGNLILGNNVRIIGDSNTTPTYTFDGALTTGMGEGGLGDRLTFDVGGTELLRLTTTQVQFKKTGVCIDGTAGAPGFSFASNQATGIFYGGNGSPALGTLAFTVNTLETLNIEMDGTLNVRAITDYENQVLHDDDVPNKKYVDDAVSSLGTPLNNIVEDITPQLGADLDANGFDIVNNVSNLFKIDGFFNNAGAGGGLFITAGSSSAGAGGSSQVSGGQGSTTGGSSTLRGGASTGTVGGQCQLVSGNGPTGGGDIRITVGIDSGGSPFVDGVLTLEKATGGTTAPEFHFHEADINGVNYIALKAPDLLSAVDRTWTLPQDDPTVVEGRALTTDASGVQSFTYLPGFEQQAVGVGSPLVLPGSPPTAPTVYVAANIIWTSPEPANQQSVQVFVDGVKQLVGIDYDVTDSTTITFIGGNEPSAASSHVEFVSFG